MLGAGSVIAGKYRLESPIGKGGMGAVWRATHLTLGRAVAVKMVLGDAPPQQTLERFLREARSLAAVRHRHVVDVIDFGEEGGRPFLVMECLEGESLAQRLERAPAPTIGEITEWISGALGGLAAIHDAGLVHRDLKPANLFLARDADGVIPKVLDFGIARSSDAQAATITHSMQTLGTPHYMSPEQVRSAKLVDARSDLYAMGVVLYQALTGRLPFDGPSVTAVIAAIVTDDPDPVSSLRPDLPRELAELVHRAMARHPGKRFEDARAMREALLRASRGQRAEGAVSALSSSGDTVQSAPTVPATPAGAGASFAPEPRARTGRRGFFAMLGMLSTLLVVGVGGAATWSFVGSSAEPRMASAGPEGAGVPAQATPTTTAPVPAPPGAAAPVAPPAPGEARFVSATTPLAALAVRIRELSSEHRRCVRVAPRDDGWAALAIGACEAHAPALRAALGGEGEGTPDATQLAAALEPVLLSTTTRSNVRDAPGTELALRATLPDQTLVVGLYGAVGDLRSEAGGRGTWTRAVAADGVEGWVASGLLRPWEHCVARARLVGGDGVVIAWARFDEPPDRRGVAGHVRPPPRRGDALLLFEPAADRVRLAWIDVTCGVREIFDVPSVGMDVEEVFVTRTAEEGETLIVVGARDAGGGAGAMAWAAYRLGAVEPSWTLDLRSSQQLPDARREHIGGPVTEGPSGAGFWPIRVRRTGGERTWYRWDETERTLVPEP